jgi:leucyl-tRNA synthetase
VQRYNPKEIEPKWQAEWNKSQIYQAIDNSPKPKRYVMEYFPYPSGAAMHVGHVRNYAIGDVVTRFARMNGFNVLHPMGWDAFGLPAENYAIKTGISPKVAIEQNTKRFKKQLMQMGFGYDWSREFASSDPDYYKWTQWFFLLLYKRGLAYQKESLQWWCPFDKTVLANEQVENGRCWRCGSEVEKKALKQWFFKITDYAERLEKDLDDIDWSESIKTMQRNWIGRSTGAEISFKVDGSDKILKVFTTRADTIFGATFMVVAPELPIVDEITTPDRKPHVTNYVKEAVTRSDIERQETNREKTGVFTGGYAINPANGQKIPIWVADYVLSGYGTGAIMAVPAHDERDWAFAKKFGLETTQVVQPIVFDNLNPPRKEAENTVRNTVLCVIRNPKTNQYLTLKWRKQPWHVFVTGGIELNEDIVTGAMREITEETGYNKLRHVRTMPFTINSRFYALHKQVNRDITVNVLEFELEDDSRIKPKLADYEDFEIVWVDNADLVKLQPVSGLDFILKWLAQGDYIFTGEGRLTNSKNYDGQESALARDAMTKAFGHEIVHYKLRDWLISRQRYWGAPIPIVYCQRCGVQPVPDDQLPVVLPELKSFEPDDNGRSPLARVPEFVHTTCPKCGGEAERETDTMDGFACSSWYFLRFADPHNQQAAFDKDKVGYWLPVDDYIGGAEHAVMHLLYARMWIKVMKDAGMIDFNEPFLSLRNQGMILAPDGQKMSKSKNNTIEPDGLIEQGYGADAIRIMELFIGPWDQSANWSVEGLGGSYRFLQRVWTLAQGIIETKPQADKTDAIELRRIIHRTIKKVSLDLSDLSFNTAISAMMEAVNALYVLKNTLPYDDAAETWRWAITTLVQLLAPFAPHITEELWSQLGLKDSIHISQWPGYDEAYLTTDTETIVVQVNGKLRAELTVNKQTDKDEIIAQATNHEHVKPFLADKKIKRTVYVPGKIVNFVV